MASDLLDPLVGTTIARRYELEQLLGRGGLCAVYRAKDQKSDRKVALKVLPAEMAQNSEMLARFQREATTGTRIEHPNVVTVLDKGELPDGGRYLVMELLEGGSVADALDHGAMPVRRAARITAQVLGGLQAAHALGIVHRDIKPENIMLSSDDTGELAKIVDFGIASNDKAAFKLTTAGIAFGTPEYISPEMATGLQVDARADLYSVGIVLYQLVTGKLPFVNKDKKLLLAAHAYEVPKPPRSLTPKLPPAVEAVILKAIEKLPEQRFSTAAEMRAALVAAAAPPRRSGAAIAVALGAATAALAAWWVLGH
jgi:serine/threonine protein kinase